MRQGKRIIVCCDGTWQDADNGYSKPSYIPYQPLAMLQIPSNVVRIERSFLRECPAGVPQIVYYHSGVGTANAVDKLFGGLLGSGITENIREAYSFITTNYVPGDEIILVGFSRGAFTARSVASLIQGIGLLTREGMDKFYAIFKDFENRHNKEYKDLFPDIPFVFSPGTHNIEEEYRAKLAEEGLTRVHNPDGSRIKVRAIAVWDTVGSLGVPSIGWLMKLGFPHSTKELKFNNTMITDFVEHAFQALALDEHRAPFGPAVWERPAVNGCKDLRQVWFPGSHANIGGGYSDQGIANVTLAWMMDQLASIGVAFRDHSIDRYYEETRQFYITPPPAYADPFHFRRKSPTQFAHKAIWEKHRPVRPLALGEVYESETGFYHIAGRVTRTPGLYRRSNPNDGERTKVFMTRTNERIHSIVRLRLEQGGLGLDDRGAYKCKALLKKGPWKAVQIRLKHVDDAIPADASWGGMKPRASADVTDAGELRWVWQYTGPASEKPEIEYMLEEPLGPYERRLWQLSEGIEQKIDHTVDRSGR